MQTTVLAPMPTKTDHSPAHKAAASGRLRGAQTQSVLSAALNGWLRIIHRIIQGFHKRRNNVRISAKNLQKIYRTFSCLYTTPYTTLEWLSHARNGVSISLGEDEQLLWDLADEMHPENGCLCYRPLAAALCAGE